MAERREASEMQLPSDPLIGRVLDGRYRVLSLIAQGGMGRVYKAEQTSLGRIVAIKTLAIPASQSVTDPQFQQRFALEAAATSRLKNPHTVTIFDYGRTSDDLFFIVMEYVEGVTLAQVMRREGRLHPLRAIGLIRQLCIALREAHRHGIVHRDIKPANLLILQDGYEHLKVLDFGIAKMLHKEFDGSAEQLEITRSGTFLGTPEYMSPEAMTGRADLRSDIYSVGVVFYLMLTGRLPFKATSPADTIMMVMQDPVPRMDPSIGVPEELENFVLRCMARRPGERFQSIEELMAAMIPVSAALGMELPITSPTLNSELELDAALLSPMEGNAGAGPENLPYWLQHRQQQLAMLVSALVVIAIGLVLLVAKGPATPAPAPNDQAIAPAQRGATGSAPSGLSSPADQTSTQGLGTRPQTASQGASGSAQSLDSSSTGGGSATASATQAATPAQPAPAPTNATATAPTEAGSASTGSTARGQSATTGSSGELSPSGESGRKASTRARVPSRPRVSQPRGGSNGTDDEAPPDGYKPSPY